jgi:hypothetical protein
MVVVFLFLDLFTKMVIPMIGLLDIDGKVVMIKIMMEMVIGMMIKDTTNGEDKEEMANGKVEMGIGKEIMDGKETVDIINGKEETVDIINGKEDTVDIINGKEDTVDIINGKEDTVDMVKMIKEEKEVLTLLLNDGGK